MESSFSAKQYLPHQQRVVDERNELQDRRNKLIQFIQENPIFKTLEEGDQKLLKEQFEAMTWYQKILDSRITRF